MSLADSLDIDDFAWLVPDEFARQRLIGYIAATLGKFEQSADEELSIELVCRLRNEVMFHIMNDVGLFTSLFIESSPNWLGKEAWVETYSDFHALACLRLGQSTQSWIVRRLLLVNGTITISQWPSFLAPNKKARIYEDLYTELSKISIDFLPQGNMRNSYLLLLEGAVDVVQWLKKDPPCPKTLQLAVKYNPVGLFSWAGDWNPNYISLNQASKILGRI